MKLLSYCVVRFVTLLPKKRRERIEKKQWYARHRREVVQWYLDRAAGVDPAVKVVVAAMLEVDNWRETRRGKNSVPSRACVRRTPLDQHREEEEPVVAR